MTTSSSPLWQECLQVFAHELDQEQFNTFVRPLQVQEEDHCLRIFAPNAYIEKHLKQELMARFTAQVEKQRSNVSVMLSVGSPNDMPDKNFGLAPSPALPGEIEITGERPVAKIVSRLNKDFRFDTFVSGKSNHFAHAAALQVADNPGSGYNPLFIYGGVGLGKTHLMHSIGNTVLQKNPRARVAYVHSERFVSDMVKAIQHEKMEQFKLYYRSLDALLIDDIQFFANKERSQEEFFHTFNALLEDKQLIVLTSDRYPKELQGLEERLKSRFGWGLAVGIEPPELETSVAILMRKAELNNIELPENVAFFIAQHIRSNVRELEGALHRVIANARFTGQKINLNFAKQALRDLLAVQQRMVSIDNIQKTVASYFKIRLADMLGKSRSRSLARPRQIAMALAKELTRHSLPEIGEAFGGRDHTTVIHAQRRIKALRESDAAVAEDYSNLYRTLTS